MSKKISCVFAAVAAAFLLASCSTTTTIIDPEQQSMGLRNQQTTSSDELRQAATDAVRNALGSPRFMEFLNKYRQEKNDPYARPVLKLDMALNETNDPDLRVDELTDLLNEALFNANVVDVTMAEGVNRTSAVADSRDLELDDNFDQSTVAQRGTLQAARLVMRPKVISNNIRQGNQVGVTRTFVIDMVDVKTGLVMWKFSRQLGFIQKKGTFGW